MITYYPQNLDRLAKAILASALADATAEVLTYHGIAARGWCMTVGTSWADVIGDGLCGEMIQDLRKRGWRRVGSVECVELEDMR
jgi:hypothetical protein